MLLQRISSTSSRHTAPEIEYDDKAALAQAQKIDALKQMDVHLNATRRLVGYVANSITRGTGPKHIDDTDLAVNYSAQAAEDTSKAAKLAKVWLWLKADMLLHRSCLEGQAGTKCALGADETLLDAAVLDDSIATRMVKDINDSYYMNTSSETVFGPSSIAAEQPTSTTPPWTATTHERHERSHKA